MFSFKDDEIISIYGNDSDELLMVFVMGLIKNYLLNMRKNNPYYDMFDVQIGGGGGLTTVGLYPKINPNAELCFGTCEANLGCSISKDSMNGEAPNIGDFSTETETYLFSIGVLKKYITDTLNQFFNFEVEKFPTFHEEYTPAY